jgi:hypothetical protein
LPLKLIRQQYRSGLATSLTIHVHRLAVEIKACISNASLYINIEAKKHINLQAAFRCKMHDIVRYRKIAHKPGPMDPS